MNAEMLSLPVAAEAAGQRLDRWLAERLSTSRQEASRNGIQRLIEQGMITLKGKPVRNSLKLEVGMVIDIQFPKRPAPSPLQAEDIPLQIVYEDDNLLVIDKPAGIVVHPAPGHESGTIVNAVLHHAPDLDGVGGEQRPGLVHRLDKETSGLLVVAKQERALRYLQAQFQDRTVYKEYLALVEGRLNPEKGRITTQIGRHPTDRKRFTVLSGMYKYVEGQLVAGKDGKEAVTDYETVAVYQARVAELATIYPFSLVSVVLHTGRTHQIRVHLSWQRHPIVGDILYGPSKPRLPLDRQFLHAHRLHIRLPHNGQVHEFVSPLPPELRGVIDGLELVSGNSPS